MGQKAWFHDRPAPTSRAALDKVFEMASIATGMMELEESNEWREWLVQARRGLDVEDPAKLRAAVTTLQRVARLVDDYRGRRACTTCGKQGHDKRNCPQKETP